MSDLFGIKVVTSKYLPRKQVRVQFRFPRSKSKRIRKKWAKRPENFRWIDGGPMAFMLPGGALLADPQELARLRAFVRDHPGAGYGSKPRGLDSLDDLDSRAVALLRK